MNLIVSAVCIFIFVSIKTNETDLVNANHPHLEDEITWTIFTLYIAYLIMDAIKAGGCNINDSN